MSIDRLMDKEDVRYIYIYTHKNTHTHTHTHTHTQKKTGILLNHEKNEIMPFAAIQMELDIITLSEVSHREKKTPYDITHIWNLKI